MHEKEGVLADGIASSISPSRFALHSRNFSTFLAENIHAHPPLKPANVCLVLSLLAVRVLAACARTVLSARTSSEVTSETAYTAERPLQENSPR